MSGTYPVTKMGGYRARKDNVGLASTTWDDPGVETSQNLAQNTGWTQPVDTVFRLRTLFTDTVTSTKTTNYNAIALEYNLASGGWNPVTATSPIQWASSGQYANGDSISTAQITGGQRSYVAGEGSEGDNATSPISIGNGNDHTVHEWALMVDSAQVSNGQTFQVRIILQSGGVDTHTAEVIPTVTISEIVPTSYTQASETDSAQALSKKKIKSYGVATESDSAGAMLDANAIQVTNLGNSVGLGAGGAANPDINDGSNLNAYSNSSWSPPTTGIILALYHGRRTTPAGPGVPTMAGNGLTWVHINSFQYETTDRRIGLFAAFASGATTGATTITWPGGAGEEMLGCNVSFFQMTNAYESGTLAEIFRQFVTGSGSTGSTGTVNFSAAGDARNRVIAWFDHDANEASTKDADYTEIDNMHGLGHPRSTISEWRPNVFDTQATATWSTPDVAWGGIGVEVWQKDAFAGPVSFSKADETDSSGSLGKRKTKAFTNPSETDAAQTITPQRIVAYTAANETDSAQALSKSKTKAYTQSSEADTAQDITSRKIVSFGVATESDSAQAFSKSKTKAYSVATEADTAQDISVGGPPAQGPAVWFWVTGTPATPYTQASETDTAQALSKKKSKAFTQASEADTAQSISSVKVVSYTAAIETDSAQALSKTKSKAYTQASETDAAQALSKTKSKAFTVATETDAAQTLTVSVGYSYTRADETDSAQSISKTKIKSFTAATEADSAQVISYAKVISYTAANETDSAGSFSKTKIKAYTAATESDIATFLSDLKLIGVATETDSAGTVSPKKMVSYGVATESDSAQGFSKRKIKSFTVATEADTSGNMYSTAAIEFYVASETDSAGRFQPPFRRASETDSSQSISKKKVVSFTAATETDVATFLSDLKQIGVASEADTAGSVTARKIIDYTAATETDSATIITAQRVYLAQVATESDSAQGLSRLKIKAFTQASEVDSAQTITGGEKVPINPAIETDTAGTIYRVFAYSAATETDSAQGIDKRKIRAVLAPVEIDTSGDIAPYIITDIVQFNASWQDTIQGNASYDEDVDYNASEQDLISLTGGST